MRIAGSYSAHFALPVVLAWYIATSASRIIDEAVQEMSPSAIPMLADSTTCWRSTTNGAVERLQHALGDGLGLVESTRALLDQDRELVTAEA